MTRIAIDRSKKLAVELSTEHKIYRGDFLKYHETYLAPTLLVVTNPFVCIRDYRDEIILDSIEHAVLEATNTPTSS